MPGPGAEAVPDEEDADEDRCRESEEGGERADGEDGVDCGAAGEDEEEDEAADGGVEPDCVDGGFGFLVDLFPDAGEGEAVVAGVGEGNP